MEPLTLAERLDVIMRYALCTAEERDAGAAVIGSGLVRDWGFSQARLEEKRSDALALMREIVVDDYLKGKGDGMSFLHLCTTRNGVLWAEHPRMEALVCLGIALGVAGYCAPKELWAAFPGGMPYVWFDLPPAA